MNKKSLPLLLVFLVACSGQLSEEIRDEKGVLMRLVPAGQFKMGVEQGQPEAGPVHPVYLDDFYIDKYEVTNVFYKGCVDAGPCTLPKSPEDYENPEYAEHPVVNVDWYMADVYCTWRGGYLPTEAQWEKAARGTDERMFPWGNELTCENANFLDNRIMRQCNNQGGTIRVGSNPNNVSPYGVYDMAGNVWEWVADWYEGDVPYADRYYANSPSSNPQGPAAGNRKVLRGGSWTNIPFDLRTTTRYWDHPSVFHSTLGFRCARTPSFGSKDRK